MKHRHILLTLCVLLLFVSPARAVDGPDDPNGGNTDYYYDRDMPKVLKETYFWAKMYVSVYGTYAMTKWMARDIINHVKDYGKKP